ncbi:PTS transporter subunit EIIC, partial [Anaerosalibacter bizertensis]|nr:PTS transporter subunit EIIC [Anaerosalibacter bizertensis]
MIGSNPYLGAVIGMIMIHPNLQNAWTVATEGVKATQKVWFGLYSIDMVGYQGHVIPVIIAVWVLAQIEKRLHKVVPAMFDLFVTPLVSVFVTGYLTLSIIGD